MSRQTTATSVTWWTLTSGNFHAFVIGVLGTAGGSLALVMRLVRGSDNPLWLDVLVLVAGLAFLAVYLRALRSFLRSRRDHGSLR